MPGKLFTLLLAAGLFARAAATRTVLDGVYSTDQAKRGQAAYSANCSACHLDDLTAYRGVLRGVAFAESFQGDSLDNLFQVTRRTMPRDAPASLSDETYLDILAYVLQKNSYPSGSSDLKMDLLKSIRIVGKTGLEPVPNFALVSVIGCLEAAPAGRWKLTSTTEPVRTRNPDPSSEAELNGYARVPLGTLTFELLDTAYFRPVNYKGHKMAVKGFLVKRPDGDQINVTSLQTIAEGCTP